MEKVKEKRLVIIENIHELSQNKEIQNKLLELLNLCFRLKIQVILCSDNNINNLKLDELVKSKMLYGLTVELKENT